MSEPLNLLKQNGCFTSLSSENINTLKKQFSGNLVTANDSEYEQIRAVWSATNQHQPALIAVCESEEDIWQILNFVCEHGLAFSIRGGGHNVSGKSLVHQGVVINLSLMKQVEIDVDNRTVKVQAGVLLKDVDTKTSQYNLALPLGVAPTTGVIGLTLGGGMGRISRKHGLTCDSLISARVILANGERVIASNNEHEDLFWALRGGCGNFGIVTEMEFRLHAIPEKLLFGKLIYDETKIKEGFQLYRKLLQQSPDELGLDASITLEPSRQKTLSFTLCISSFNGDEKKYLDLFEPLGESLANTVTHKIYPDIQHSDHLPFGGYYYYQSGFTRDLSDESIDVIINELNKVPHPKEGDEFFLALQQLSGTVGRVPNDATAFAHREALCNIITLIKCNTEEEYLEAKPHVDAVSKELMPYYSGLYANDSSDLTSRYPERVFGDNFPRLKAIKKHYDPDNLFNRNMNIS